MKVVCAMNRARPTVTPSTTRAGARPTITTPATPKTWFLKKDAEVKRKTKLIYSFYQQHPFEHISYIFPVDTLQMSVSVFMRRTLVASPTHQCASARTAGQGGSAPQVNEQLSLKHRTIGNWIKRHFSCLLSSPISLMFLQFVNMDLT